MIEKLKIPTVRRIYNQSLYGVKLDFDIFNEEINRFLIIAINEMERINKDTLCYNLQNLKIFLKSKDNFEELITASYYPVPNQIEVLDETLDHNDIYHELLHMSSRYRDGNNVRTGFAFATFKNGDWSCCGVGLNEGYTALLEDRYFSQFNCVKTYKIQQRIMKVFEYIIGKDNLEKYYFNADIETFLDELRKYLSEDRIIDLIGITDFITVNNKISNPFLKNTIINKTQELNNIMRELAFGYFDYYDKVDSNLVNLINESTCRYYVYKNKKYSLKQTYNKYNL